MIHIVCCSQRRRCFGCGCVVTMTLLSTCNHVCPAALKVKKPVLCACNLPSNTPLLQASAGEGNAWQLSPAYVDQEHLLRLGKECLCCEVL